MKIFVSFCLFIIAGLANPANSQPEITRNSMVNSTFSSQENILVIGTGGPVIIRNAKIEATKRLTFTDATVVLDNANIVCDELVFNSTVTTLQVKGTVQITCRQLIMPSAAVNLSITNFGGGVTTFSMAASNGLPTTRNFTITETTPFKVTIEGRP